MAIFENLPTMPTWVARPIFRMAHRFRDGPLKIPASMKAMSGRSSTRREYSSDRVPVESTT